MSSSSSSMCAIPTVNVRCCVFNQYGALEDGSTITVKLKLPPPNFSGIFDDAPAEYISSGGQVLFTNMFQGAYYYIYRGRSSGFTIYIPYTSESEIGIDPIFGNDSTDLCL